MITKKDLNIIAHLRKNARNKVTNIAKTLDIPVTTIYDKIKSHEKKGLVKKHTTLLDFSKLGYLANVMLAVKVASENREKLGQWLKEHNNVNSLYRVNLNHDFLADVVFENHSKLQQFIDNMELNYGTSNIQVFNLSQELKKEEFLANIGEQNE